MNYLIQAYACSPYKGGEYAVSWGWITHLDSKVRDTDCIWIASLTLKEKDIIDFGLKHVRLISVSGMKKWNFLNYNALYYRIWQRKVYTTIKKYEINIDICHVYSLSDFRLPGDWWKLKNCKTILGPVGGGQVCPDGLKKYDDKSGKLREIVNLIQTHNPIFRLKLSNLYKVYVCNRETQTCLNTGIILPDVPLNDKFSNLKIVKKEKNIVTIISVGRLINKKGLLFLLDVLSLLNTRVKWRCLIYGDGNQKEIIKKRILDLNLQDRVRLMGNIQYDKISDAYKEADVFVLPSLRESGGSVLIEAMAHKLPIVALKMSLADILSEHNTGLFVNINQTKKQILWEFADKIRTLIENKNLREVYGENAYNYVNSELNWDKMIDEVYGEWI